MSDGILDWERCSHSPEGAEQGSQEDFGDSSLFRFSGIGGEKHQGRALPQQPGGVSDRTGIGAGSGTALRAARDAITGIAMKKAG